MAVDTHIACWQENNNVYKRGYRPAALTFKLDYPTELVTILFPPPFFPYGNIILMGGKWKILHDSRDSCTFLLANSLNTEIWSLIKLQLIKIG